MKVPEPRYVRTDDGVYIAYQVIGDGPVDIAWQFDWVGNLDCTWDRTFHAPWFESLASFGRLILHDRRATGLSSRNTPPPNLETRVADLRAVLDDAGSQSTVIASMYEGLAPGVLLAATEPDRVRGLVWWGPTPRTAWAEDYPWGEGPEVLQSELEGLRHWGTHEYGVAWADQFGADGTPRPEEGEIRAVAKSSRNTCTPDVALALNQMWWDTDLRSVLPSVRVPTLILTDPTPPTELTRAQYVASLMPMSEVVVLPGDVDVSKETMQAYIRPAVEAVRRFVGVKPVREGLDSVLASVLFTDIVGSTQRAAAMGDHAWKSLVEQHHALVRESLTRWQGVENDTAGDGFYATFDGPARAIRCALEIIEGVPGLGLEIRAGVHIGECEMIDGELGGIAVNTGARISALAGPSQVLVSQTVKDLVAGSGLTFSDAGEHDLKGVPQRWTLYSVVS